MTSLFTLAGPYDNGGNGKHNETDVEFLGSQPRRVQFNFWANDEAYASRNEMLLDLGFDPAAAYHRYGCKWAAGGIQWFVDGQLVHSVTDSASHHDARREGDPGHGAGDAARSTDAAGTVVFYSSRSRSSGAVTVCVSKLTHSSLVYDAGSDSETCDSLAK